MNNCTFVGRIVNDLELQYGANDVAFMRFRIAVRRQRSKEERMDFVPCKAFNKTAEFIAKYFKKGDPIWVETSYRTDQYEDSAGTTRYTHDFVVNNAGFCPSNGARNGDAAANGNSTGASKAASESPAASFEFPF